MVDPVREQLGSDRGVHAVLLTSRPTGLAAPLVVGGGRAVVPRVAVDVHRADANWQSSTCDDVVRCLHRNHDRHCVAIWPRRQQHALPLHANAGQRFARGGSCGICVEAVATPTPCVWGEISRGEVGRSRRDSGAAGVVGGWRPGGCHGGWRGHGTVDLPVGARSGIDSVDARRGCSGHTRSIGVPGNAQLGASGGRGEAFVRLVSLALADTRAGWSHR